jgi:hypothetical protein
MGNELENLSREELRLLKESVQNGLDRIRAKQVLNQTLHFRSQYFSTLLKN